MKLAPIQLSSLSFRRISVELDIHDFSDRKLAGQETPFDFESVVIATSVGFAPMDDAGSSDRSFLLTLHVVIDNTEADAAGSHRRSPYLIDMEAGAVVEVAPGAEALGDIGDLALVNGTSLLWSAIREQVSNLTARMPAGLAMLPTVHFLDLKQARRIPKETAAPDERRSRATKKRGKRATPP
jgi:hypothetical protein